MFTTLRKWLFLVVVLILLAGIATVAGDHKVFSTKTLNRYRDTVHITYQHRFEDESYCSATAIGPHALLTASHCELPTNLIMIDGDRGSRVIDTLRDEYDHSIYLLRGVEFKTFAKVSRRPAFLNEPVFVWGNPEMWLFHLYVGKHTTSISGHQGARIQVFNLNIKLGDSGSGIFNQDGEIVGVVSLIEDKVVSGGYAIKGAGAIPLRFASDAYQKALDFK